MTRRTLASFLTIAATTARAHDDYEQSVSRTMAIHGIPAPFAVAGYLMGEHALMTLQTERFSPDLEVTHHSPALAPWISIVDGLQAGTGASLAARNLKTALSKRTYCVVTNRKTGGSVTMRLVPAFAKQYSAVENDKLFQAGLEVSELKPEAVFTIESSPPRS